jgi:hypothetical protein
MIGKYRCDLCGHRKKSKFGDLCSLHKKCLDKDNIEPPDFCYVWGFYEDKVEIKWYNKGKLE